MAMANEKNVFCELLKDITILQERDILHLQCKTTKSNAIGHWFKNSGLITSCDRINIRNDGMWHMLEIKNVTEKDGGLYYFVIKTMSCDNYTKTLVMVKGQSCKNSTHMSLIPYENRIKVSSHLGDCYCEEGGKITLKAEFFASFKDCIWYKNYDLVSGRCSRYIIEDNGHMQCKLFIEKAKTSDAGIYTVVVLTKEEKLLCTYADVVVTKPNINVVYQNEKIPYIWQSPNECIEVYNADDVLLVFKISCDMDTMIKWKKDEEELQMSHKITSQIYYNKYITLTIRDVDSIDSGRYSLVLGQINSLEMFTSSTILKVKTYEPSRPSPCSVDKELMPTLATVGDGITFRCSFDVTDISYTFVVWIVGYITIEKSTFNYKVICDGDEYILYLPEVTPLMAGEVTCQLRHHVPARESILLCKTTTSLVVLPPRIEKKQHLGQMLFQENNIFCDQTLSLNVNGMDTFCSDSVAASKNIIMQLLFCKTSTYHFYFEILTEEEDALVETVQVTRKTNADDTPYPVHGDFSINWSRPGKKEWYAIDLCQPNREFFQIGISATPCFNITEPPEDKLYKFRIRKIPAQRKRRYTFNFIPDHVTLSDAHLSKALLPFRHYRRKQYPNIVIGKGSFGTASIIRRPEGDMFAAKAMKFVPRYTMRHGRREFNITKRLAHPNTIVFIDGYYRRNRNGVIFTMEYLWGGDLVENTQERENMDEFDYLSYMRQVLLALEYLHSRKIVHLDVKPENIICVNRNSRIIKLIDFGMARRVERAARLTTMYGSQNFVSPEMINMEPIDTSCDMWAVGALAYWLLTGYMPFTGESWTQKSTRISTVDYKFDDTQLFEISDNAKDFISFLLLRQPDDRMTAVMALNSDWIACGPNQTRPSKKPIKVPGGLKFVDNGTYMQIRWKVIMLALLLIIKLRARRRDTMGEGPKIKRRRVSVRIAARRLRLNSLSTSRK